MKKGLIYETGCMYFEEGQSIREIAKRMDASEDTVRTRLRYYKRNYGVSNDVCRKKHRELLEEKKMERAERVGRLYFVEHKALSEVIKETNYPEWKVQENLLVYAKANEIAYSYRHNYPENVLRELSPEKYYGDAPAVLDKKDLERLESAIKSLSDRERKVFLGSYDEGKSFVKLAKEWDISSERVRQIVNKCLASIKEQW